MLRKLKLGRVKAFLKQKSGDSSFLDVAIKVLIVVVIGGSILLVLSTTMPDLFGNVMDKVQEGIDGVDLFDGVD